MKHLDLTNSDIEQLVIGLKAQIHARSDLPEGSIYKVYPVPRGGIPVAYLLTAKDPLCHIADSPAQATYIIDDLIDSGATQRRFVNQYPNTPFLALFDKTGAYKDRWVTFPWERGLEQNDESATDNIVRLLEYIGENVHRGGLVETPARVLKAWKHWTSGYDKNPKDLLKTFEDGSEGCDQMVTVKDIPFYTHCEHHMAPFFGTATVSYIPNKKIVGLSKLSRVVDMYARRLQVQERMTNQIADAISEHLDPVGVGVCITARHLCMESRGICQQGHHTITTALRGALLTEVQTRAEFMDLIK